MPCPAPDAWSELADPARRGALEDHLDGCADCRALVGALAKAAPGDAFAPELAAPGTRIGRYVVEGPLGAGGMGVVLAAFDPRLERTVALKLVRILDRDPDAIERARIRLVAEAKAMARVAHPNVVAVHEVVEDGDELFIAMERVDGTDLAGWLAEAARSPAAKLRVVLDAGRGLAAAHAAGIVHRDVKPANILVDRDGHARLTDLGLAAAVAELEAPELAAGSPGESRLVGTPGFIAPEVAAGARGDARADQYAFAITADQVLAPRGRIKRVVERARAEDPDARYPSMKAVVAALAQASRPRRWPILAAAGAVLAAIAVLVLARGGTTAASCANDPTAGGAWTPIARSVLAGELAVTDRSPQGRVTASVLALADDRARAWGEAAGNVCRARARGTEVGDVRGACLEDQRRELAATLAAIGGAKATTALSAVAHLPGPLSCDHAVATADDAEHRRVSGELREIMAVSAAGHYREAARRTDALAATVSDPQLAARVALRRADFASRAGDETTALPIAHEAVALAERAHDDATRVLAMRVLVGILDDLGRTNELREVVPLFEAAAAHQPLTDVERAGVESILGNVAQTAGDYPTAAQHYRAALAAEDRTYGGRAAPERAGGMQNLGAALHNQGKVDEARSLFQQSVAMFEATVGPDHPDLAMPLTGLGNIAQEADDYDAAAGYYDRVIAIRTRALGADHPYLSEPFIFLAKIEHFRKHDAKAIELYRRALALSEHGFGTQHPLTAVAQGHLAELLEDRGDHAEARRLVELAVATWDATGASLPDADDARFLLAQFAWDDGAHARATRLADTARAHYAALPPPWDRTAKVIATWQTTHH